MLRAAVTTTGGDVIRRSTTAPAAHALEQCLHARRRRGVESRLDRGRERSGELLAELDAPLVERVDVPDHALYEYLVLVPCDQASQRARLEPRKHDHADGSTAGMHLVHREPRQLGFHDTA